MHASFAQGSLAHRIQRLSRVYYSLLASHSLRAPQGTPTYPSCPVSLPHIHAHSHTHIPVLTGMLVTRRVCWRTLRGAHTIGGVCRTVKTGMSPTYPSGRVCWRPVSLLYLLQSVLRHSSPDAPPTKVRWTYPLPAALPTPTTNV